MAMRENDVSNQEIRNKLQAYLPELSRAELDELFTDANVAYEEDTKGRGGRRIRRGIGLLTGGIIITIPLAMFGGIFVLIGWVMILAGVFQLGMGIYESRK